MRTSLRARFSAATVVACLIAQPLISAQSTGTPAAGRTTSVPTGGRYQLVVQTSGPVLMIDSATGRVWQYMELQANEQHIDRYLERLIMSEELKRSAVYSTEERKQRKSALRTEHASDIDGLANPCTGANRCMVELDRISLLKDGSLKSDIVK